MRQDSPCISRPSLTSVVRQQVGGESVSKGCCVFCNRISHKKIMRTMIRSGRHCSVYMTAEAGGTSTIRTTASSVRE